MSMARLDETFKILIENDVFELALSPFHKNNLKHTPRPYQTDALARFAYYIDGYKKRMKPTQLLFHMATGSGKTLIMAGAILELYRQGYRNFIFFVNTDTIIRKTKENFLNPQSSKYLFKEQINIDGQQVQIREVQNFESINENDINILFSTIQGLHTRLTFPKENSITFDDFSDLDVVLLSDEAHHINTLTKKKLSAGEQESFRSWESTVMRIFRANPNNVMLEFTATAELDNPNIKSKYDNALLVNYPLKKFREDGYSKEVQTNQIDFEPIDRALVGTLISQYKKKSFADNGIIEKPVVLMKSKTIAESKTMETAFVEGIKQLNEAKIKELRSLNNATLQTAFAYFDSKGISNQNLIDELQEDFSAEKTISVNSKDDSADKQISINSLEDADNPYRVVFAVDKLNEGWDVLNLFDIVRLYDTRDSKGNKPGKTTVQEAQLIGRGARYCPFVAEEGQTKDQRKYDGDLQHPLRVCETLHYHCSHNPRYIDELTKALKQIGIVADERIEVDLLLKDSFKETDFYKKGFILLNQKVENNPELNFEYQEPNIQKNYKHTLSTRQSQETLLFDDEAVQAQRQMATKTQLHELYFFGETIIRKAMMQLPFYQFSALKKYFPSIRSIDDFINGDKYLRNVKISVTGLASEVKDLSAKQKLQVATKVLKEISETTNQTFGDFVGTKTFRREPVRKHFRNKKLSFSADRGANEEYGRPTLRPNISADMYTELDKKDWYAFNENYGTSEEKYLVKYFDEIMDKLEENFTEIYLLRNERHFKLYRFSDGKATEPDFVLFMKDKRTEQPLMYQLFIEPKGANLLEYDQWKEDFLLEIEDEAKLEIFQNEQFKLIGMPFYNEAIKRGEFDEAMKRLVGNI